MQEQHLITEEENIAKRLKKPNLERGEPKAATVEDIRAVLEALSFNQRWGLEPMASIARDRAIILFLVDTGCRVGGLCSITNERLDLADYRAIVHEKGKGGRKPRLVFFSEATKAAVEDWLHYHPTWLEKGPETPLFVGLFTDHHGVWLSPTGVYQLMVRRAKSAGLRGRFTPHALRHSAAREWLRNGADLATALTAWLIWLA